MSKKHKQGRGTMDIAIRQEMSWMRVLAAESALAYPENKLIAVMDNPQAAHAALSEIQSRGLGLTELAGCPAPAPDRQTSRPPRLANQTVESPQ
jgi:hypothetical protein